MVYENKQLRVRTILGWGKLLELLVLLSWVQILMLLNGKWTVGTSGHPTGGCTLCRGQSQLEHFQTEQTNTSAGKKIFAYVLQTLLFKEGLNFFELVVFFRTHFHQQSNFFVFSTFSFRLFYFFSFDAARCGERKKSGLVDNDSKMLLLISDIITLSSEFVLKGKWSSPLFIGFFSPFSHSLYLSHFL